MNKRLRKKHRRGEFVEFCFEINADLKSLSDPDLNRFIDRWLEKVESRGLACGGGFSSTRLSQCISKMGRGSASAEDREYLIAWLQMQPEVTASHAGELHDGRDI